MEAQTDLITAILLSVSGAVILAIAAMIVMAYNRIIKTQDAFLDALSSIRLEQVEQNNNIKNNHQHIVRLERVQESQAEDIADSIVTKLRAAGGF